MFGPSPKCAFVSLLVALICLAGCTENGNPSPIMPSGTAAIRDRSDTSTGGYSVTDLGALPGCGGSEVGLDGIGSSGQLNKLGQAAGTSKCGSAVATLFDHRKTMDVNTIGAVVSVGQAINDSGQVAGYEKPNNSTTGFDAFLYSNGKMRSINDSSLFPNGSEACGINKSGEIVGVGFVTGSSFHAFLHRSGKMVDLNPFNGRQSIAVSINDAGEIIGSSSDGPNGKPVLTWLHAKGKITDLSESITGLAINNKGQIVGTNNLDGELYSNGVWTDLGAFPRAKSTVAQGINDKGQIVGYATVPKGRSFQFIGLIFTKSGSVDLNTLIPPDSGFTINQAEAINNAGQIVGNATINGSRGGQRVVLLTPK